MAQLAVVGLEEEDLFTDTVVLSELAVDSVLIIVLGVLAVVDEHLVTVLLGVLLAVDSVVPDAVSVHDASSATVDNGLYRLPAAKFYTTLVLVLIKIFSID